MEKLNDYLKTLLSSCSDELKLEPNKNPHLVSGDIRTDLAPVPLLGTQISTMVFPLIPAEVKSALPHNSEVEFIVPHDLGEFNFTVQKSSAGFIVTIRPMLRDQGMNQVQGLPAEAPGYPPSIPEPLTAPSIEFEPLNLASREAAPAYQFESISSESAPPMSFDLESSSLDLERLSETPDVAVPLADLVYDEDLATRENAEVDTSHAEIDIISVNDPAFQTVFSDNSDYEPPGQRDDFMPGDYIAAVEAPQLENSQSSTAGGLDMPQPTYTEQPPYSPPPAPVSTAFVPAFEDSAKAAKMNAMFQKMADRGASDLHLSSSMQPMIRKDGRMAQLEEGSGPLAKDTVRELLTSIMPARSQEEFAARSDADFAYEIPGLGRFRCNVFMDRKGMGGVFRLIPSKILTAEELGLSKAIMDLCDLSKGLVVVTGPTGCGKSTTLCAMVDSINKTREDHIITIEDPIEFVHESQKCLESEMSRKSA
jgi:hypothetical protein